MKCQCCNGTGRRMEESDNGIGWIPVKCEYCNGTGEVTMINEEWFCQLPTEEKAKVLGKICFEEQFNDGESMSGLCKKRDAKYWQRWLQEIHK